MKKKNKFVLASLCSLLLAGGIGTTLAYYTDSEKATNTFTVGKVEIDLKEDKYPGNQTDKTRGLLSGQEVPKNPVVTNTGVNDAVIFLKVTVPVEVAKVEEDNFESKSQELFYLKTDENDDEALENSFDSDWVELSEYEEGTDYTSDTRTYLFGYKYKVAAQDDTSALFDKVQVKKLYWDKDPTGKKLDIDLYAYAIQADDVINELGNVFDTKAEISKDDLSKIYQIYVNQASVLSLGN